MSKNELKAMALPILQNCVVFICLTVLAVVFNNWWIVLLSIIFWNNVSYKSKGADKNAKN